MKEDNYIYISAKIWSLEPRILDKIDMERMIDAPDLASAFKVLNDTDYSDNLLDVAPENYRDALAADAAQLRDFLKKTTPDKNLFALMMLPRDFVNLKLLFKARQFGIDVDERIKSNILYATKKQKDMAFENHINDPETMQAQIREQKWQVLDQDIKDVILETIKKFNEKTGPDEIDAILTQQYFDTALKLAKKIQSEFIINYVQTDIDTANLLIWLRARRLGLSKDVLRKKLIKGGHADISQMIGFYPEDVGGLKPFVSINFDRQAVKAYGEFCEDDQMFKLEKAIENYKVGFIKKAKTFSYGPEVVFGYYLAKLNANINTSIILTGKLNNLPAEEIRKTVREAN